MLEAGPLRQLPLRDLHLAQGARMVPFAGWEMPVRFEAGVMAEHIHTRAAASLFDVSHMGQLILRPRQGMEALLRDLEALTPADVLGLVPGRQRYALLTGDEGGILDDAMVANRGDHLLVVVNAARREADLAHLSAALPHASVEEVGDRVLLAVQGPRAEAALEAVLPGSAAMRFMDVATLAWRGHEVWVARSGYTGEDGFEVSVPEAAALPVAQALLAQEVRLAGLGARDSLRLEAGLPLHGFDVDAGTSPIEAALGWSVGRARRAAGERAGGFPGAARILSEMASGPARLRVGLRPEGRQPVRAGSPLVVPGGPDCDGAGIVTSGGFGPSVGAPVAMGYVSAALAAPGTQLLAEARGRPLPLAVATLPFVSPSFKR